MRKILLTLLVFSISIILHSQNENPFKEYGYDVLVATSSKGEFQEFHDQTDIVEIGSVLYNRHTKEIVKILDKDDTTIDISSATAAMSIDPLCEKYYWISPYVYCMNNPIKYVDPDGLSTWVFQNSDGTYRVVGGDLEDKDYNIYVYTLDKDKGLVRGNSIGVTTSMTSFYNTDANDGQGSWVTGATINPNDKSGEDFFCNIVGNTPSLEEYMKNATGGMPYDFKATNGTNQRIYDREVDFYRGMPIGSKDGKRVYTSARDIGNMTAGYVAGASGMPWGASRMAFDALQSYQDRGFSIEGSSTQNAEYFGWKLGNRNVLAPSKLENFKRAIKGFFGF